MTLKSPVLGQVDIRCIQISIT